VEENEEREKGMREMVIEIRKAKRN